MQRHNIPNLQPILATLPLIIAVAGCSYSSERQSASEADCLYKEQIRLIRAYTDSIAKAPDSAAVFSHMASFRTEQERIYFKYSPDTDLAIHEGRNDTLSREIGKMLSLKEQRLKKFSQPTDSAASKENEQLGAGS